MFLATELLAKAEYAASGMDVKRDEDGQLVTTQNKLSDKELQQLGLWLPPVGFNECKGDIFRTGPVAKPAAKPAAKPTSGIRRGFLCPEKA